MTASRNAHDGRPSNRRRKLLMACGALAVNGGAPAAATSNSPVRVGFISPNSGRLSAFGAPNVFVTELLAPRLAAGVRGSSAGAVRIDIDMHDAASSPQLAADIAARLVASGVHMLVASGTPDICNPVADVCEGAGVPCITTVAPWQAWLFGRKGQASTGFRWTYHFFAGMEEFADVYASLFKRSGLPGPVGGIFGDDLDGDAFVNSFPGAMGKRGMTLFDPGRIKLNAPDFKPVVRKFQEAGIQIVTGNLPPPVALEFFEVARQADYRPRMASIAKAFIFPETVAKVGHPGLALTNEVWWSPAWPFKSSLTGMTSGQLCERFESATGKTWVQPLGFSHALIEVVADAVRTATALTREGLREAVSRLQTTTVVGVIDFRSRFPALNVCTTPAVGGQWQKQPHGGWALQVVDNSRSPFIPVTSRLVV